MESWGSEIENGLTLSAWWYYEPDNLLNNVSKQSSTFKSIFDLIRTLNQVHLSLLLTWSKCLHDIDQMVLTRLLLMLHRRWLHDVSCGYSCNFHIAGILAQKASYTYFSALWGCQWNSIISSYKTIWKSGLNVFKTSCVKYFTPHMQTSS